MDARQQGRTRRGVPGKRLNVDLQTPTEEDEDEEPDLLKSAITVALAGLDPVEYVTTEDEVLRFVIHAIAARTLKVRDERETQAADYLASKIVEQIGKNIKFK